MVVSMSSQGVAQVDTISITLDQSVRMALEQGPAVEVARESYKSALASFSSFRSSLYPQLRLQGQAPGYVRSISSVVQPDGTTLFTPSSQASSTLNLSLSQQIPFTGGEIFLSTGLNRLDLLETNSVFYRSTPLSLTFRQPLFQLNTMWWNAETQDLSREMAARQWKEAREQVAMNVTDAFFATYTAKMNVENSRNNVQINDTLYQISIGRYNVGKIAENDLLQSELAALNARTSLSNALIEFERAQKALAFAIGIPKGTPLMLIPPDGVPNLNLEPQDALVEARKNRSDISALELQTLQAERALREAEFRNGFSATLTANAGLNQRAGTVSEAYRGLLEQQQLSVSFEVPLIQWGAGSEEVEAAEADRRRMEATREITMNTLEDDVYALVMRVKLLSDQVAISARADTMAQRRFEVSKDRYLIGKIDVTNLFLAQNEKDSARRQRVQTLWDFWSAHYRLRRLTLYDFIENESIGD
jgi:outer membrane protein TolC